MTGLGGAGLGGTGLGGTGVTRLGGTGLGGTGVTGLGGTGLRGGGLGWPAAGRMLWLARARLRLSVAHLLFPTTVALSASTRQRYDSYISLC